YAVHVTIAGAAGQGAVTVPVSNIATQNLGMPTSLGWILSALGIFLAFGFVSLIGAAVRESVLPPGDPTTPKRRTRARFAMGAAMVVLVVALTGGRAWWNAVDAAYARGLYQPMQSSVAVLNVGGARVMRLTIADSTLLQKRSTPLIPDHGKIMHFFLVGEGESGQPTLAHLHPLALDSASFEARAGRIPAGRYRYYADVVHESGFAETMLGSLQLGAPNASDTARSDVDDAISIISPEAGDTQGIPGGGSVAFERPRTVQAGADLMLRFDVRESNGTLSVLSPYMGMPAHAVVVNADGSVFAHLHSNGSFSMAAQGVLAAIEQGDTLASLRPGVPRPRIQTAHSMQLTADGHLEFPFAFPKAGEYTVWVQFRRANAIQTAAFAVTAQ
ncbi:MAG: hypothetical protein ABI877_19585, partial [Gemmatimonadaceae bacterium]